MIPILVICRGMLYALITESMEYASLAPHANLIIQFWLSLKTTARPHRRYLSLMHLFLVIQEGCQLSNQLRHLHLNYQVTSFSILIQKLLQKIHPNKLTLHQIPPKPPQSLHMIKNYLKLIFLLDLFFASYFEEKYIIHTIYSPF